jgi:hypothetical protein
MNDITALSREFCEQNEIREHKQDQDAPWLCVCGAPFHGVTQIPDFSDARNVLDVVMKRKDAHEFIGSIATSLKVSPQGCEYQIPVELVRDLTGKLLKLAVEWRREHAI